MAGIKNVPAIRFKGFNNEWKACELGELIEITSASRVHKNQWTESGVPFFRSSDVVADYKGLLNEKAFISFELYKELSNKSGCVQKNDLLVTGGGSIGLPYLVKSNEPLYFKDADLLWLKNGDKLHGHFLYSFFSTLGFRRYVNSITHIGTISHYTVVQAKSTPIGLPEKAEQDKIGEFLLKLDKLINLHQAKRKKLVNLKKAMLEKMFPKDGLDLPEIRFKGFEGAWEVKLLGDICKMSSGGTPASSIKEFYNGPITWVSITDMTEQGKFIKSSERTISEAGLKYSSARLFPKNTILYAMYASIGECSIALKSVSTSQAILGIQASEGICTEYLYIYLTNLKEKIKLQGQQGSQANLNKGMVENFIISLPCIAEQVQIGNYFSNLDKLITLYQTELDKLNHLKKASLEKMFV